MLSIRRRAIERLPYRALGTTKLLQCIGRIACYFSIGLIYQRTGIPERLVHINSRTREIIDASTNKRDNEQRQQQHRWIKQTATLLAPGSQGGGRRYLVIIRE